MWLNGYHIVTKFIHARYRGSLYLRSKLKKGDKPMNAEFKKGNENTTSMLRNGNTGIAVILLILLSLVPSFLTLILGQ
jgi:hypothetical protein